MANISSLGELNPIEPLDLADGVYKDAMEAPPLPKAGRYTVVAPDTFPQEWFDKTRKGDLYIQIDPKIVGPTNEGYTIRFTKVSAKVYKRSGVNVSQLGDYLRATGRKSQVTADPQSLADAVEQTANQVYQIEGDWSAYHSGTKWRLDGMNNFPSDGNGGHTPWVPHPTEKDPISGEPVMVRANFVVQRFIAA